MTSPITDTTFGTLVNHAASLPQTTPTPWTFTGTNKTAGANEVVCLCVSYNIRSGSTNNQISSITVSGLTFTKQYSVVNTHLAGDNIFNQIEVWTAPAASQFNGSGTNLTYTVNFSQAAGPNPEIDNIDVILFAVSGVNSVTSPFDSDGSFSAFNTTSTTAPVVTFNTAQADDLLIGISANSSPFGGNLLPVTPSGWTNITSENENSGINGNVISVNKKSVSSTQSSATYQDAATGSRNSWAELVFAFTADAAGTTGTWASTEAADTFSAAGSLSGPWHSTEAADSASFTGTIPAPPPTVDATFGELTGHNHRFTPPSTFTFSGTNKTAGGNELVLCCIGYNLDPGADATVSSVTVTGLTFTHQFTINNPTSGADNNTIEVWAAPASSAFNASGTNLTYTISWNGSTEIDGVAACVFAVEGLYSINAPYDQNLSLPATAYNTSNAATPTATFSTSQAANLLIGLTVNTNPFGSNEFPVAPSGWTQIASPNDNSGLFGVVIAVNTKTVTSTQSSATFKDAATGNSVGWTEMVLALTSTPPPPPSGTWASSEADDTFSATGGLLGGSWHSMEAKDIFDFERFNGPHGPWGSTEATDAMSFSGTSDSGTVFDHATASAGVDFQNNNLTITNTEAFGTPVGARSTTRRTSGKLYAEFNTLLFAAQSGVGIGNATTTFAGWGGTEGSSPGPAQDGAGIFQNQNGTIWVDQVEQNNWAGISLNNAVVSVAIDLGANLIWFRTNGGHWNGITGANPATGVGGWDISGIVTSPIYLYAVVFGEDDQVTMNAGASAFVYTVPSGFTAWDGSIPPANPLQLDGYATGGVSSPSFTPLTSATVTLTTTKTDDVIVVAVATGGFWSASQVTGITDTAGLVWHRRNRRWQNGGFKSNEPVNPDPPGTAVNQGLDIEIWWAHAPTALTGDVITVDVGGCGFISLIAWGVSGANFLAPWDTHSQAGGYIDNIGNNAFSPAMAELSTNAANCFLFGIHADNISNDSGVAQQPWTYVTSVLSTEHDGNAGFESFAYQLVEEPQISTNVPFGVPFAGGVVYTAATVMFDSIVAAGETGTADEIVWFWDSNSVNNVIQLSTGTTLTLNYSSTNFNLMVVVEIMIQSASGLGEVTSISESQGLVSSAGFERRSRVVTGTPQGTIATEIWWAWMPMFSVRAGDDTLTINTSGTAAGDIVAAQAWGLGGTTGAYGLGDPFWDINPSLPATNSSNSDSPVPNATNITTTIPTVMLVAWTGNNSVPVPGFTEPYVTLLQAFPNTVQPIMQMNSNAPNFYMGFEFLFTDHRVTDETAEFLTSSPEANGWAVIADAIPVGPPVPPVGEWASNEHADTFHATGFVPIQAAWHSTDHADEFTGAPAAAPYFGEGWLGWVPAHAIWASNERADQMDLYGWIVGFGCVGQMGAVESKDRVAASNRTTVTGVWQSTGSPDRLASAGLVLPLRGTPPQIVKRRLLIIT